MNEKISFKDIWHAAGIAGLVLASISTAYLLAEHGLSLHNNTFTVILTGLLQILKIVACIMAMRAFMKRFKLDFPEAETKDIRRMGTMTAFLSALIFAGVSMAFYTYHPEIVAQALDIARNTYSNLMDENARQALGMVETRFPQMIFGYTLVYCFLFGWILSAILAPRVAPINDWDDDEDDEEENNMEEEN